MNSSLAIIIVATTIAMLIGCKSKEPTNKNAGTSENKQVELAISDDEQMEIAIAQGHTAKVQTLLQQGFPVSGTSSQVNAPAYWAISLDKPEILRVLIRHGLDVNYDWGFERGNLLTNATQLGHTEIVRLLLESGASPDRDPKKGRTPLYAAIIYDKDEIKALLLEHHATLNDWDRAALEKLKIAD